tara:strand:+ start:1357 stop:1548 length:192 start_codon:yes stop_codon:yes gene_type:complete
MNSLEQKMWDRLLEEKAELVAEVKQLREGIWGIIKNAESAISAGSEHSKAFRFMAQELRELAE